jgi:hypothetical protein
LAVRSRRGSAAARERGGPVFAVSASEGDEPQDIVGQREWAGASKDLSQASYREVVESAVAVRIGVHGLPSDLPGAFCATANAWG